MNTPCAGCHTRCCFDYTVTITGYDAWRIASGLQLAFDQFVVALTPKEPLPEAFRLDASERSYALALRRRGPDDEHPRACVFWLSLPHGTGRCGIHRQRPDVCRVYPTYLRDGAVHLRPDAKCPVGAWTLPTMDIGSWRRDLERHRLELGIYREAVGRWNQGLERLAPGDAVPLGAYYAYLVHFYDGLAPIRDGLTPSEEDAVLAQWDRLADAGADPLAAPVNGDGAWSRFSIGVSDALERALPAVPHASGVGGE